MGGRMTLIKLRYIKQYQRNGKFYYYFRRKGCPVVALPGSPGSRDFNAAYEAALNEKPIPVSRDAAGTMGKLITDYYGSVDFANLKPNSRRLYRGILDALKKDHGHRIARDMGRDNARKIRVTVNNSLIKGLRSLNEVKMATESLGEFPKVSSDRTRLESLLRVAAEQWPNKSPEDQQHERRFIARDLAAYEALRNG